MNDNTFNYFLFSIAVVVSLGISFLALSFGENIMNGAKIIGFVIVVVIYFFFIFENPDQQNTKSWTVYKSGIGLSEDTERLLFDTSSERIFNPLSLKTLRIVEFNSNKLEIKENDFSKCKNIEEIIFYQRPKKFDKETFSKCLLLKHVKLVGDRLMWSDFEIKVPEGCEVEVVSVKTYEVK